MNKFSYSDHSLSIIIPLVLIFHLGVLAFFSLWQNEPSLPLDIPKVVMRSVKLASKQNTQKKEVAVLSNVPEKKVTPLKPVPAPIKKEAVPEKKVPTPTPKEVNKKTTPTPVKKPSPIIKKELEKSPAVNKDWILAAKEKIGKIDSASDKMLPNSEVTLKAVGNLQEIQHFQSDLAFLDEAANFNIKESAYRDELARRIKLHLNLPEFGEAEIRLTVDRQGKVLEVKILNSLSKKNAAYIEKEVLKIQLPGFGDNFNKESAHTFPIRLLRE